MIPYSKKLLILPLLILVTLVPSFGNGQDNGFLPEKIQRVIDGDTVEISNGNRVRLLGIDAPEKGEPLFEDAVRRLEELTSSGVVSIKMCEDLDIYGRFLGTISAQGSNVNLILLREGKALPMLIPPCGRPVAADILTAAARGARSGKGIYSLNGYGIIQHTDAGDHIGEHAMVQGKIAGLHRGRKAWHLNFGSDWKTDFTAVIFRDGQQRFNALGIDPGGLVGSEVLVVGKIKRYNGPEIIVRGPDQVIPLSTMTIQDSRIKIQKENSDN